MYGDEEYFYFTGGVSAFAATDDKPIKQHLGDRNRDILARFDRHHLRELLFELRGKFDDRNKRRGIRNGERGIGSCNIGLADDVLQGFGYLCGRERGRTADLHSTVGTEGYRAVRFEDNAAVLAAQLHDFNG